MSLYSGRRIAVLVALLLGVALTNVFSFLLFRTLVSLLAVLVAGGIFILTWNCRAIIENRYLLYLGIAYFAIGVLDLVQVLTQNGMPLYLAYIPDLYLQLWMASRLAEGVSLILAGLW